MRFIPPGFFSQLRAFSYVITVSLRWFDYPQVSDHYSNKFKMTGSTTALFVLRLLFTCTSLALGQYSTDKPCLQTESTMVILSKDSEFGNFSVVYRMEPGVALSLPGVQFRQLEEGHPYTNNHAASAFLRNQLVTIPGVVATEVGDLTAHRRLHAGGLENDLPIFGSDILYYAWECACHDDRITVVYCPLDINTCLRPYRHSSGRLPGCRNLPKAYDFRRYTFLLMIVWFVALFIALATSRFGGSVLGFFVSKCFPSWNERTIDRLLERQPERVRDMIRLYIVREHRTLLEARRREQQQEMIMAQARTVQENVARSEEVEHVPNEGDDEVLRDPPTSLVLRTKRYRACARVPTMEHIDSSSETDEEQCAICFLSFEDGDKIGALKCNHLFHSDCLKMWLLRRNACPLCQVKEIAQPQYEEHSSDTVASTTPTDDNNTTSSSI